MEFKPNYDEICDNFEAMGLQEDLLRGIYGYGFEKPSEIQKRAILPIIQKRDMIVQSRSGTGKTAAFTIGILQQIDYRLMKCQALILVPTRELAQGIRHIVQTLGDYLGVKSHVCNGKAEIKDDIAKIQSGVHVIVGTPGRVSDMLRGQVLGSDSIKLVVLDEVDEMLSRGFEDQINDIFRGLLPSGVQVGLFSSTMPTEVLEIGQKFMKKDPVCIVLKGEELSLEGVKQYYISVEREDWKWESLLNLLKGTTITKAIIFCETGRKADWLADQMRSGGYAASSVHGSLSAEERNAIFNEFRTGSCRVLIATDLLARAIDVGQVSLLLNYDLPKTSEKYIHRIGTSGRSGRKAVAINFVAPEDVETLKELERFYNTSIEKLPANIEDLM